MMSSEQKSIKDLLQSTERLIDLSLCYHDYLMLSGLPEKLRTHRSHECIENKSQKSRVVCMAFCGVGGEIDRKIKEKPDGWILRCPLGLSKIVVPVFAGNTLAGVLFATSKSDDISDYHHLLLAVATRISILLLGEMNLVGDTRKGLIQNFINHAIENPVQIKDLAKVLNLSDSRTGHLVQKLFGATFNKLLRDARLNRASILLSGSELPISTIALSLCFYDQSHFTRAFSRHFSCSPTHYRKRSRSAY